MKALKIAIIMILVLNGVTSLYSWMTKPDPAADFPTQVREESVQLPAAEGLDLAALTALTKEIRSGQEFERRLNEKGSINNLDLNGDKKVDYLFVREFGDVNSKIGYSLTVEPEKDEVQEVATVTVEKNGNLAEIQVIGNEQIYGDQAIFNDSTEIEREKPSEQASGGQPYPMYNNYFYPRPLWFSPWHFGFYPAYFAFYPVMGRSSYVTHVNRTYNTGSVKRGGNSYQRSSGKQIANPNQGKVANRGISRSLQKPTNTQKKFQATRNRNLRSGGFGSGKTASRSGLSGSSSGQSRSQVGTSRGSFFGSSSSVRRSTPFGSGSVRSGSIRSRSFSFGK